ncbi:MAG: hypothetical protein Q7S74_02440 [Nanoarchaeota archaeon]|nr:hypothetical protein [Nanoarchaeota archaeon]
MAIDVKNLIAAINPDVFCDNVPDIDGKILNNEVKKVAKEKGYLEAAKIAKLKESDYLDIVSSKFSKNAFSLAGLKNPIEKHTIVYDVSSQSLEQIYFWILDYVNKEYGGSEKLIDNFISSVGSGQFSEMNKRATVLQEEAIKIFGTVNTVLRSVLNIIYDLKEFKMRLAQYDDYKSKDERVKIAALLSLKQLWMDNVDIKRGTSSIKGMLQQFDFVTILDAFMVANSLNDIDKLDLNERVKRILQQRVSEFQRWIKESEQELRKRFEIEKIYLRSQVSSIKLYARWLKPYLKAAQQLEQNAGPTADIVNAFNTTVFELVLLAKGEYNPALDVANGELPQIFKKMKFRKYLPLTLIEFRFRTIPDRSDQRGGYTYRGRAEVTFTGFALNGDELKLMQLELEKDDVGDMYKLIGGATDESLGQLKDDIKDLLGDEEKKEVKSEDVNPFRELFSFLKKKDEKVDLSKGIPKDSDYEKVIRSQAILEARMKTRKLYDSFKKIYNMPTFPPTLT